MIKFIQKILKITEMKDSISNLGICIGALVHDFRELKDEVKKIKGDKEEQ